jgi:hypothetical protein
VLFFDLVADPKEVHPQPPGGNSTAAELESRFKAIASRSGGSDTDDAPEQIEEAMRRRLRSLGYAE